MCDLCVTRDPCPPSGTRSVGTTTTCSCGRTCWFTGSRPAARRAGFCWPAGRSRPTSGITRSAPASPTSSQQTTSPNGCVPCAGRGAGQLDGAGRDRTGRDRAGHGTGHLVRDGTERDMGLVIWDGTGQNGTRDRAFGRDGNTGRKHGTVVVLHMSPWEDIAVHTYSADIYLDTWTASVSVCRPIVASLE